MPSENVNSIMRVLNIVECFAFNKTEYSISELAEELALPMSTVHRQLKTLLARGYVQQNKETKLYGIGSRMIHLGCSIVSRMDLRRVAHPYLQKLSDTVEETVHLAMLTDFNVFYADKIECLKSLSCRSRVGAHLPAHATGVGKMLLSGQPESFLEAYCRALPDMPVFTAKTITDPVLLRDTLKAVAKKGYAMDMEENEAGLICVAAPIFTIDQKLLAAISISGPIFRMEGQLTQYLALLKETTQEISKILGHVGG